MKVIEERIAALAKEEREISTRAREIRAAIVELNKCLTPRNDSDCQPNLRDKILALAEQKHLEQVRVEIADLLLRSPGEKIRQYRQRISAIIVDQRKDGSDKVKKRLKDLGYFNANTFKMPLIDKAFQLLKERGLLNVN